MCLNVYVPMLQCESGAARFFRVHNPETGHTYPWIVRSSAMVNHLYCY